MIKKIQTTRRKAYEKKLPKGKTIEDVKKELVEKLKKHYIFLATYIEYIFNTEKEIEEKIIQIENKTKQYLKKEYLAKELWILRYAYLNSWFLQMEPPKNEKEFTVYNELISYAFQNVSNYKVRSDCLTWLTNSFAEFADTNQLKFDNLKEFESNFTERIAEKISSIVFESTNGRLGGDQYDSVLELIMTTIEKDNRYFYTGDNSSLSEGEIRNIKKVIKKMEPSEKDFDDFINLRLEETQ